MASSVSEPSAVLPPVDAASAASPPAAAPVASSARRTGTVVAWLALGAAAGALAVSVSLWNKLDQAQQELARRSTDTLAQASAARAVAAQAQALTQDMQARLGVATWPTPEMARLVRDHGLGVVASEYSVAAMAKALNALRPEDVVRFKQASHAAARTLSAEVNRERMLRIVDEMLMDPIREKRST